MMNKAENSPKIPKNPRNFPKKPEISEKIPKQGFVELYTQQKLRAKQ